MPGLLFSFFAYLIAGLRSAALTIEALVLVFVRALTALLLA